MGAILIAAAVAAGAWTWYRRGAAREPAAAAPSLPAEVSIPGTVQAIHMTAAPVPITGVIDAFHAEVGQEVYEGQLLAQIKSQGLESAREAAQLAFEAAQTKLDNLEYSMTAARLEESRASADEQRTRAEADRLDKLYQRQKTQFEGGALPKQVYLKTEQESLQARSEAASAQNAAAAAARRVAQLQQDADAARKTLAEKTEDLEETKAQLSAGDVASPVNGIVAARRGNPGEEVDQSIKDLFQIATDLSTLELLAEAPPGVLPRIKAGQEARIRVAEAAGEALIGFVKKVEGTGVIVEFANPYPEVKPGLTAQVTIQVGPPR